jgi:hypothetical protein
MAIFAVIKQPSPNPVALAQAVTRAFPGSHYVLSDSAWLIAAQGTAIEVSQKLGLPAADSPAAAVVIEVGSYYGRANPAIWTWIKTNWEASAG